MRRDELIECLGVLALCLAAVLIWTAIFIAMSKP
jgi:hypothetical protein